MKTKSELINWIIEKYGLRSDMGQEALILALNELLEKAIKQPK